MSMPEVTMEPIESSSTPFSSALFFPAFDSETSSAGDNILDDDWEEWDGKSPFWVHCLAGSWAGVIEHTLVYPLDTVRTNIQVACSACAQLRNHNKHRSSSSTASSASASSSISASSPSALLKHRHPLPTPINPPLPPLGMFQTLRHLMSEPLAVSAASATSTTATSTASESLSRVGGVSMGGWLRLWRGVETMLIGCIPAHAGYFSSYEVTKMAFTDAATNQVSPLGSSLAGAAAVLAHDLVMTPLDTVKQRMQLGHYSSVATAMSNMHRREGIKVFYRSFPVTLTSNIPYGMLMVAVNEHLKQTLTLLDESPWQKIVVSSSVAGFVASAATTPLDRIKTSLQTQHLLPTCYHYPIEKKRCTLQTHQNWREAAKFIFESEGFHGFWRGTVPRVLSHTPAVAFSWTAYEAAKQFLMRHYNS